MDHSQSLMEREVEEAIPNPYCTLHLIVRHGDTGAVVVTASALVLGLFALVMLGALWAAPIVLAGAGLLHIVVRSYVELVRVIVDMLLPK